ncbi:hypothetical protein ACQKL0_02960 [Peribacillus sp. NPDC097264]|uniref:hypothetical protein n=1 Tax=Peribacillus sp. NPDC097264 TaxID=3390616 RepID=UPI003D067B8A
MKKPDVSRSNLELLLEKGISGVDHIKNTPLTVLEHLTKKNAEFYKEYLEEEIISVENAVKKKRSLECRG